MAGLFDDEEVVGGNQPTQPQRARQPVKNPKQGSKPKNPQKPKPQQSKGKQEQNTPQASKNKKPVKQATKKPQKSAKPKQQKKLFPWYKIFFAVIIGLCMIFGIFIFVGNWYTNNIRYPAQATTEYTQSGMYALDSYSQVVHELGSIDDSSYLPQEFIYANSNTEIMSFMRKVANTVSYDSDIITAKNVFGNDMVDPNTLEIQQIKSPVVEGEEISTFYVDYDAIVFNKAKIKQLMREEDLSLGDVDYQNRLVPIFCRYMNNLSELPIKEVRRVPNISKQYMEPTEEGKDPIPYYIVLPEEDIFFDTELFSSEEFYNCLDRFSKVAGDAMGSELLKKETTWSEYKAEVDTSRPIVTPEPTQDPVDSSVDDTVSSGTEDTSSDTPEITDGEGESSPTPSPTATPEPTPIPILYKSHSLLFSAGRDKLEDTDSNEVYSTLKETKEFLEWMSYSEDKRKTVERPARYGYKNTIVRDWCGAYYWQHFIPAGSDEIAAVKPKLGNGTRENPADYDTSVVTQIIDENGEFIPIRVTLKDFGVSKRAIDWFESKDIQNRGFNLNSGVQYCFAVFEVTNLSDSVVTIYDNSSLSDINVNLSVRTGSMFGLQEAVTLRPDESGIVESWSRSTELYLKYLVWGADFDRRADPVWFRVLAGNPEDTSTYKLVHVEGSTEPEDGVEFNEEVDDYYYSDKEYSGDVSSDLE